MSEATGHLETTDAGVHEKSSPYFGRSGRFRFMRKTFQNALLNQGLGPTYFFAFAALIEKDSSSSWRFCAMRKPFRNSLSKHGHGPCLVFTATGADEKDSLSWRFHPVGGSLGDALLLFQKCHVGPIFFFTTIILH
jgi:hypothetical protein